MYRRLSWLRWHLLEEPVSSMQQRVAHLLAEWPDNPLLMQLKAICQRLLGTSIIFVSHANCKAVICHVSHKVFRPDRCEFSFSIVSC